MDKLRFLWDIKNIFLGKYFFSNKKFESNLKLIYGKYTFFYTNIFFLVKKIFWGDIVFFSIIFLANNLFFTGTKRNIQKANLRLDRVFFFTVRIYFSFESH